MFFEMSKYEQSEKLVKETIEKLDAEEEPGIIKESKRKIEVINRTEVTRNH